jgi:predicted dehydrogenase
MINWGVIGLGNMGGIFIKEIQKIKNARLNSIASRDLKKLNDIGQEYKINNNLRFNHYHDLIKSNEIDAVYISTLNNTHLDLISECIKHKKKILCEKPAALNLQEINTIKSSLDNNFFYEAIAYYSNPQTNNFMKILKKNEIGKIKKIKTSFGFKVKKINLSSRLFNKKLGGGVLLDLGCYPLSFLMLCDDEVEKYKILKKNISYSSTGIEDEVELEIITSKNIIAEIRISFKQNYDNSCVIEGENGKIIISNPWLPKEGNAIEVKMRDRSYIQISDSNKSAYAHQIENVSEAFERPYKSNNRLFGIDESVKYLSFFEKLNSDKNN